MLGGIYITFIKKLWKINIENEMIFYNQKSQSPKKVKTAPFLLFWRLKV